VASNAANRRAMVGWLNPSARPAARIEPSRATARNTRTSSQSIDPPFDGAGRVANLCGPSRPSIPNPSRVAMTCSFIARLNVSTSDGNSYHQIQVPRKRSSGLQKRRSLQLIVALRFGASKRFRRHQNCSCTTAPGRVWRKPTYWPRGARCIGGMTLVRALVRNLRTCPAMPREKVQAAKLRGRKYRCGGQGRTAP